MFPKSQKRISLADSIAALRDELEIAAKRQLTAEQSDPNRLVPPLNLTEIVLEAEVVSAYDREVTGKLNYWIASAGGTASDQHSATQKVTIRLVPIVIRDPESGRDKSLMLGESLAQDIT